MNLAILVLSLAARIVPSSHSEQAGKMITLYGPESGFHVVVTNVSAEPVRLWREWCSWGYYNLSFEVTDAKGKVTLVKKAPRGWDKNFPDKTLLLPGDHLVFFVTFDPITWQNGPLPPRGKDHVVTLRAHFEVTADADSKRHRVWTGKVASLPETFTIFR